MTTSVSSTQVRDVRRGQSVTVTPAGWATSLTGTVSAIGLLPDSSGNFAVTVTVQSGRTVAEGSTASVSIVTGVARNAVTVPTSAISRTGTRAVVRVLDGDTVTRTVVTVGVVGKRKVSISQGLKAGATVVLADLDAAVPTSTTNNISSGSGNGDIGGGGPTVACSASARNLGSDPVEDQGLVGVDGVAAAGAHLEVDVGSGGVAGAADVADLSGRR